MYIPAGIRLPSPCVCVGGGGGGGRYYKCHFAKIIQLNYQYANQRNAMHKCIIMLVRDWAQGKPAAFDITVTSPLTPAILAEASRRVGAAAEAAENRKHTANDPKCAELG